MKRWTRTLIAAAAAGSLCACEHLGDELGSLLVDSAFSAVGESLTDQGLRRPPLRRRILARPLRPRPRRLVSAAPAASP